MIKMIRDEVIKLVGSKEDIEQAIVELKSNIDYDNLNIKVLKMDNWRVEFNANKNGIEIKWRKLGGQKVISIYRTDEEGCNFVTHVRLRSIQGRGRGTILYHGENFTDARATALKYMEENK